MKQINYLTVIENLCYGAFSTEENDKLANFLSEFDYTVEDMDKFRELARNIWDKITFATSYLTITEDSVDNCEPF